MTDEKPTENQYRAAAMAEGLNVPFGADVDRYKDGAYVQTLVWSWIPKERTEAIDG